MSLATGLFLLGGGVALAAGINEVAPTAPPAARASSAKKLALKKHRTMLRRFARFLGQRITLDLGDHSQAADENAPTSQRSGEAAPSALIPLDRSLPLGAMAGARPLQTGTRLSVNSHRVRLVFQLRW